MSCFLLFFLCIAIHILFYYDVMSRNHATSFLSHLLIYLGPIHKFLFWYFLIYRISPISENIGQLTKYQINFDTAEDTIY